MMDAYVHAPSYLLACAGPGRRPTQRSARPALPCPAHAMDECRDWLHLIGQLPPVVGCLWNNTHARSLAFASFLRKCIPYQPLVPLSLSLSLSFFLSFFLSLTHIVLLSLHLLFSSALPHLHTYLHPSIPPSSPSPPFPPPLPLPRPTVIPSQRAGSPRGLIPVANKRG
ncbi:hypothetical protein IWX90DRAFT_201442 [Phyllosticta citrichinensis]|uniref:Uncharacterized protein n=1 Tax=Phyllosticta citrichinensis TaxID=1130410 RepID=A0ABR1XXU7_9PEZI